jgi:ATP-binding protein involved in chromosome partitioning
MIDPRRDVIGKRLSGVGRIIAFCSAKGGVGKTFCASVSAILMARKGMRVGLLDLDLQGASTHIVLGVEPRLPEEDKGLIPLRAPEGIAFMTVAAFTQQRALPLRGGDVTNAIRELFAVTQWGRLDYLIIDMPPGIGDEVLDLISLVSRLEAMVVSTPSAVSVAVVERLLAVIRQMKVGVVGVIANMSWGESKTVESLAERTGTRFLGEIPFDPEIEKRIGDTTALLESPASRALRGALAAAGMISPGGDTIESGGRKG